MCPTCDGNLRAALVELEARAVKIACTPTPTLLERYNAAQATLAAVLHNTWRCDGCAHTALPVPMPLFERP